MRIGIVCHPSIGGSGLVATELGIGLAKLGHEVHFIARSRPFKLEESIDNVFFHSVEAIHYPLFDDPLYAFSLTARIVEVAETHKLDVVHAHYSIPHSLCSFLASEISSHKFATVTTIHGTDVTVLGRDKPLYPLNQFSINQSDIVTTVSHFQKEYINRHFEINKEIEVVYNFIDSKVFTPDNASIVKRRMMAADDEKILMHVSNFRPVKNTQTVIKVFAEVLKKVKCKLVLVGSGPEIEATQSLAARLNVADKILFLGNVKKTQNVIANADCVLQPSVHESFSMVVLEAMSSSVPTVSSNVDGIPEVATHGETGFIADLYDIHTMSEHVIELFTDESLAARFGEAGRKKAQEAFAWQLQVKEYYQRYQKAIEKFKE